MLSNNFKLNAEEGFSILELLIVMIILGIIASVSIPVYLNQQKINETRALETNLIQASVYVEQAKYDNDGLYPTNYVADNLLHVDTRAFVYSYSTNQLVYCLEGTDSDGTNYFVSSMNKEASTKSCQQANVVPNSYAVTK
jgi:prepilin-type N-terminal cleavage/methylation domain-containing protein